MIGPVKNRKLNNAGVSLVELIVALLIMMVIAVPTIQFFDYLVNANKINEDLYDAETLATNVVEAVKVYGLEGDNGTAAQVFKLANGAATSALGIRKGIGTIPAEDNSVSPSITRNPDGSLNFEKNSDNKYSYTLYGVREGGRYFDVKIDFDSNYQAAASGGAIRDVNEVESIDLSAFNSKTTAFINPMASSALYYDESAIEEAHDIHEDYFDYLYDVYCAEIDEAFDAEMDAYDRLSDDEKAGRPAPSHPGYPDRSVYPGVTKSMEELAGYMKRNIKLTIADDLATGSGYLVNSSIDYTISLETVSTGIGRRVSLVPADTETITRSGYCNNAHFDDLEAVYFVYIPFPYMSKTGLIPGYDPSSEGLEASDVFMVEGGKALKEVKDITINENREIMTVTNGITAHDVDMYVVMQAGIDHSKADPKDWTTFRGSLTIKDDGSLKRMKYYSQVHVNGSATASGVVKTTNSHVEKIVKVDVKIYDHSTGELLNQVESTISK